MAKRIFNGKPVFVGQALLILLPLVVLAVVSALSLRQDRILAEHDAAERAQVIAESLLPKIWSGIFQGDRFVTNYHVASEMLSFMVDDTRQLISPSPLQPVPVPKPLNLDALTSEQKRLWLSARQAELAAHGAASPNAAPDSLSAAVEAYREVIASQPPDDFAGTAAFTLGLLLVEQGQNQEAAEALASILDKYPNVTGESGLPLQPLVELKLVELGALAGNQIGSTNGIVPSFNLHKLQQTAIDAINRNRRRVEAGAPKSPYGAPPFMTGFTNYETSVLNMFGWDIVWHPTPLTPYLLDCASDEAKSSEAKMIAQFWKRMWDRDQLTRELFEAARSYLPRAPFLTNSTPRSTPLLSLDTATSTGDSHPSTPAIGMAYPAAAGNPSSAIFWFTSANPIEAVAPDYWPEAHAPSPNEAVGVSWHAVPMPKTGIEIPHPNWLVIPAGISSAGQLFFILREYQVGTLISEVVDRQKNIPEYFGIGVELAGRKITWRAPDLREWHPFHYGGKGGGWTREYQSEEATKILASASGAPASLPASAGDGALAGTDAGAPGSRSGIGQLKVNVYLTSASALYARQSARTFWFGSLIAVSALAALIGLATAWRTFHRQQLLNEMKSNFVSSVSHELRAPIASVRLMAESLERGKVQDAHKQSDYFRFIGQECRRLSALIENVLDFARIEQQRKEYEFEPTDMIALVRQTVALMETYAAEKQIGLALSLPDTPVSALCDGRALQQALVNLIDNAIKHSPREGTVTIGLGGSRVEGRGSSETGNSSLDPQPSAHLTIWVEDHGDGIPPEEQGKIFERFYRRGSELRRETQGVGIGLSIVKHIVEAHGGRVVVRSAVGQGSRLTIELPIANGMGK